MADQGSTYLAVLSALRAKPINAPLLIKGLAVLTSCIVLIFSGKNRWEVARDDFKSILTLSTEPAPCRIPLPDLWQIERGLGISGSNPWTESRHPFTYTSMQSALCNAKFSAAETTDTVATCTAYTDREECKNELIFSTLASVLDNDTMVTKRQRWGCPPGSDATSAACTTNAFSWLDAAASFESTLCHKDDVHGFQAGLFGDIKKRITRAYMHAHPGFVRYSSSFSGSSYAYAGSAFPTPSAEGCLGEFHPFPTAGGECPNAAFLQLELQTAAEESGPFLVGSGSLPVYPDEGGLGAATVSVERMLYRLLALAVVGYADRSLNSGLCFHNIVNPASADGLPFQPFELCDEIYNGYTFGTRTGDPVVSDMKWVDYQATRALDGIQCPVGGGTSISSTGIVAPTETAPPPSPSPPGYLDVNTFQTAADTSSEFAQGTVEQDAKAMCLQAMHYGLFDHQRLMGLPDPLEPYQWIPLGGGTWVSWFAGFLYYATYAAALDTASMVSYITYPKVKLRIYVAYRLASTVLWLTALYAVVGFFAAYAFWPAAVFVWQRILRVGTKTTNEAQTITMPRRGPLLTLSAVVGLLVATWCALARRQKRVL